MAEQENLRIIRDAYAAFVRGDIATVLANLTDDVVWDTLGPAQIPYAGVFRGKDGVAQFFGIFAENDEVQAFEPRRFFAEGDMVVVLGHYAARIKSTGNLAEIDWVQTFKFRDGKVAEYRDYFDSAKYAQAYEPAGSLT
jgi:uncharacterized protein